MQYLGSTDSEPNLIQIICKFQSQNYPSLSQTHIVDTADWQDTAQTLAQAGIALVPVSEAGVELEPGAVAVH